MGDVQLCYALPFVFGNIRNRSFRSIAGDIFKAKLPKSIQEGVCIANNISGTDIFPCEKRGFGFCDINTAD